MLRGSIAALTGMILLASTALADALPSATEDAPLAMFAPLADKTWVSGKEGGNFHDVSVWEWGVEGRVLIVKHSANNGAYSGVTVIHKDEESGAIVARYATSASFYTDGVYTPTATGFTAEEVVRGEVDGITRVKSGMDLVDGKMVVWSQYEKDGSWSERETRTYREASN